MKKQVSVIIISLVLLISSIMTFAGPDDYSNTEVAKAYAKANMDTLMAKAAILMDVDSGRILSDKNMDNKLAIASVTKVMTTLMIFEAIDSGKIKMDTKVPVTQDAEAMGGSQVFLKVGESFTVDEMLKAIIIHSANDSCVAMADIISGSESVFVVNMNRRAKELGMVNTNFLDCTGLTDEGHYSSAHDVAIMGRELLLKHPKVINYSSTWMDTFRDGKFRLDNTNKLVKFYNGTTGLKTGFTTLAGYCLAASAKRENLHLLTVVLGEPDTNTRFAEAKKLLDTGFANYKQTEVVKKGEETGLINVEKGVKYTVKTVTKDSFSSLLKTEENGNVKKEIRLNPSALAPVEAGTKVGEMVLKLEDKEIGKIDLVTVEKVEKANFFRLLIRKVASWFGVSL